MPKRPIFLIEEYEGSCWVEWKRGAYWLYGNEVGLEAGPCDTVVDAVIGDGRQFGSSFVQFETRLPEDQLRAVLNLRGVIIFENIDNATVNGVESASTSLEDLIEAYRISKRAERFRVFKPRTKKRSSA